MYKRLTCLILLLLLMSALLAPSGKAAAWTVRLERSSLTGLEIGFREPPLAGKDGGDWVWRLAAGGHNFVFKAPVSDPVFLLPMTIALDNGEPMWVQGSVSFGRIRMIVTFPPFTVVTGTGKIKMDARLDQCQAVILEPAGDVTKPPLNTRFIESVQHADHDDRPPKWTIPTGRSWSATSRPTTAFCSSPANAGCRSLARRCGSGRGVRGVYAGGTRGCPGLGGGAP